MPLTNDRVAIGGCPMCILQASGVFHARTNTSIAKVGRKTHMQIGNAHDRTAHVLSNARTLLRHKRTYEMHRMTKKWLQCTSDDDSDDANNKSSKNRPKREAEKRLAAIDDYFLRKKTSAHLPQNNRNPRRKKVVRTFPSPLAPPLPITPRKEDQR